jgi:quaternary ammonium compound-resistance protein SugE
MNWILLIVAGLFETLFAFCIGKANQTEGKVSSAWFAGFIICLFVSMGLLLKVTKTLPIGTAYAVWTGIGAVGTALIGIIFFKEPATLWRLFFIITLIGSIAGLKYVTN